MTKKMEVKRIATAHDGVGDICSVKTTINGQRALLVSVYITPGTPMSKVEDFFELNLMAYSHKVVGLFKSVDKLQLSTIPIILGGDLNVDLKSAECVEFLYLMRDNWKLELNNDPAISTTRGNTCIDAVFTRHVEHLQTMTFISYFSYHKPLLSITAQPLSVTGD